MSRFERIPDLNETQFMKDKFFPVTPVSDGDYVILMVDRRPTAIESVKKFFEAKFLQPNNVVFMQAVGLKIQGRSSCYNLWSLPGISENYAVDVNDDQFVAKTKDIS